MPGKVDITLIGIGGIGCALAPFLARYLQAERQLTREEVRITLVDGDAFESKNAVRQSFETLGNKAKVKASELARSFPDLSFRAVPEFVTAANLPHLIKTGNLVFLAVDNHATRRAVSRRCEELSEVVLISGGNDFTYGNVQIYVRQDGQDITLPLTRFHPEIADPKDRSPAEMSCEELAQEGAPQLLFMNLGVACAMLNAFYAWRSGQLRYGEVYLDIVEGRAQPVVRAPRDGENDR
ncbi:MAG: ThiF family adenylyltransferase [Candidatus Methylomirabilis oxyfera]|nr:ThiF family adenylyltransferase [Candidatus Methylomirabilis oxyfera]